MKGQFYLFFQYKCPTLFVHNKTHKKSTSKSIKKENKQTNKQKKPNNTHPLHFPTGLFSGDHLYPFDNVSHSDRG